MTFIAFPGHAGRDNGVLRWRCARLHRSNLLTLAALAQPVRSGVAFPGHAGRDNGVLRWRCVRLHRSNLLTLAEPDSP
jgi:hypothetical protein